MPRHAHLLRCFRPRASRPRRHACRASAEQLEDRRLLSVTFTQTNLLSDVPGRARATDPNLVNPWGLAVGLNSGIWVAENGKGRAATFDGAGKPIPSGSPQHPIIPSPDGKGTSTPTGVATNGTGGFVIASGTHAGPSSELFATEDGTIAGWNSSVNPTRAVVAVNNSASGAVYKGLAQGFAG